MSMRRKVAYGLSALLIIVLLGLGYWFFTHPTTIRKGNDGVSVSGNQLIRNGKPFVINAMLVTGTNFTPAYLDRVASSTVLSPVEGTAAYEEWRDHATDELAAIKKFGGNTVKFYFSQYGFDPESKIYSEAYVDQDIAAIKLARSEGFVVIAAFQAYSGVESRLAGQANVDMPFDGTARALHTLVQAVGSDTGVLIEPYHRPALTDTPEDWQIWLNGGVVEKNGLPTVGYQTLVNDLRQQGAKNIIVLDALDGSRNYSGMPAIADPLDSLVYGVDGYTYLNHKEKGQVDTPELWQAHYGFLVDEGKPVLITEWTEPTGVTPSGGNIWCLPPDADGVGYPLTIAAEMIKFWTEKGIGVVGFAADKPDTDWLDFNGTPSTFVGKRCGDLNGGPGVLLEQKFGIFDTQNPTAPTGLTAVPNGTAIQLSWASSTDNVYVAAYEIYRDGSLLAIQNATSTVYSDANAARVSHTYYVSALDASGNPSGPSNSVKSL